MKQFAVKTKDGHEVNFNFPTSISEISEDYLTKISDALHVADNYSLVALCYSEVLSRVIVTCRTGNKNAKIKVTPIFVKAGNCDIPFIKEGKMKQRVVTMQSQLSLGVHVNLPYHKLTIDFFANVVKNAEDKAIYEKELANADGRECIFLEFKLIPNSDIMGLLDIDIPTIDNNYVSVSNDGE